MAAHMMTLRNMSISVAGMLESNRNPVVGGVSEGAGE